MPLPLINGKKSLGDDVTLVQCPFKLMCSLIKQAKCFCFYFYRDYEEPVRWTNLDPQALLEVFEKYRDYVAPESLEDIFNRVSLKILNLLIISEW